jgi:hypothetical protein
MKKFLITEAEKSRILGMHYNAMGKSLVSEQNYDPEEFRKAGIQQLSSVTAEDAAEGRYSIAFTENTNDRRYYYMCATNPEFGNEPWNKAGAIYDGSYKIANDPFVLSQSPEFKKMMAQECKPVIDYIAKQNAKAQPESPAPQVAAATATWSDKAMSDMAKSAKSREEKMAAIQAETAKVMANTTFLSPEKEKAQLDLDAKTVGSILLYDTYLSEEQKMFLKRKINTLIKTKPEYKGAPYYLNINF